MTNNAKEPIEERIKSLPKALDNAYQSFQKRGGKKLQRSPGATDDVVFSLVVWYVSGDRLQVHQIRLHDGMLSKPSLFSYRDLSAELAQKFYIEGQTDFLLAAIRKSDPRFTSFKEDPDIRTVWTSTDATAISLDRAIRFGRKVIRATSENYPLVRPDMPLLVSADSDCSLMSLARGFEWITH